MNHQLEKPAASLQPLDSKIIKCFLNSIIKELQHHKGVVLVDVKVQDGTHIIVKL
ncbi:MAG TPA: hypothetical protein VNM45_02875 [Bacillus sp. (in: firmicutes)]|nr:hypothetical protein [Bacillus sp. (in: firmicutes)]